jgi:hypothetical protein
VLSRLSIEGKWTMFPQPARPGDNRPSGETAIGIPIAYPAISQEICLGIVPEAPMLLRVARQSNSDHGLIACDPRRRNSTVGQIDFLRDAEASRRREQSRGQ